MRPVFAVFVSGGETLFPLCLRLPATAVAVVNFSSLLAERNGEHARHQSPATGCLMGGSLHIV